MIGTPERARARRPQQTSAARGWLVRPLAAPRAADPGTSAKPWSRPCCADVGSAGDHAILCKLRVGSGADPLEREADTNADRVMAAAGTACAECQKGAKRHDPDDEIHGKLTGAPPANVDELEPRLGAIGGGQPLPTSERAFFEPRFGHDFGRVRVHASHEAQAACDTLHARAFTRGHQIAFAAGQWSPGTTTGRRLLAHELTHVVQQERGSTALVQRDLATPPPATPPAAQPDLTPEQIAAAMRFNRKAYDAARTKLIQDLIGATPTGTWTEDDIRLVASLQEEYGLRKDGMVGPATFQFLDREVRRERLTKSDKHCLLAFRVDVDPTTVGPVAGGQRSITGHHAIRAQFSRYCGCADYQYRQFIRGHWRRTRGGVVTDLGGTFSTLPGGAGLTPAFQEDGNTTTAALNYGHRTQANEGTDNGYFDDAAASAANQASGCHYRADDTPGGPDGVVTGDVFDVQVQFRGEIQRNGRVVETKTWNDIHGVFPVP